MDGALVQHNFRGIKIIITKIGLPKQNPVRYCSCSLCTAAPSPSPEKKLASSPIFLGRGGGGGCTQPIVGAKTQFWFPLELRTKYLSRNSYNGLHFLAFFCFLFNLNLFPVLKKRSTEGFRYTELKSPGEECNLNFNGQYSFGAVIFSVINIFFSQSALYY